MKKLLLLIIMVLAGTKTFATHNLSAEITYTHLSGYTYQATITTYTKISAPADRPELEIFWSGGSSDTIPRINGNGTPVAPDIKVNIYEGTHTYPGPGSYLMYFVDQNRNQGIVNILGSVNVPMYVESMLEILPVTIYNNSVQFIQMPSFNAVNAYPYKHNITAYDPDGDCLTYELVACKQAPTMAIPTYSFPQASNTFNIDSINGEITWDAPILQGEYAIAVRITEWRNGMRMGYVIRDFEVIVTASLTPQFTFSGNSTWQVDTLGNYSYILAAGDSVQFSLVYTDSINLPPDINAYSEMFGSSNPPSIVKNQSTYYADIFYKWIPSVARVRSAPYVVTFRGSSAVNNYGAFNNDISVLVYVFDANTSPCSITISVNEIADIGLINLYPNPTSQSATLSFSQPLNNAIFKLLTLTGKTVLTKTNLGGSSLTIDLSDFATGIYIAEVVNGNDVARVKVVKE